MGKEISIKESLSSKELFDAFKLQLKKDLSECGCESEFVDKMLPQMDAMKKEISGTLKEHDKKPGFNIQQLLYRVDINEKELNKRLKEKKEEDYLNIVAELMIKRILQKVVLRKYFDNNGH
jgi:hypothetical protein